MNHEAGPEAGPAVLPIKPETSGQPTGAWLTPDLTPEQKRILKHEKIVALTQLFRLIGFVHREGIITTVERDKGLGEFFEGLPDEVQDYFRLQVKGGGMTYLSAILKGKEINDHKGESESLESKSKGKAPREPEKLKQHKRPKRRGPTPWIISRYPKSQ